MVFTRRVYITIPSLILSICFTTQTNAQIPFLTHYTPKDYKAGIINWQGVQEKSGMLYFANMDGILQFDGLKWQLHYLPKKEAVFSIALHNDGKIYVGGARQLGFMKRDSSGLLQFTSLRKYLSDREKSKLKTIYNIFMVKDVVVFQGIKTTFIYQNKSFQVLEIPSHDMFFLGKKILIRKNAQLFEYLPNGNIKAFPFFKELSISSLIKITPLTFNRFLLLDNQRQFSIYDTQVPQGQRLKSIPTLDLVKNTRIQTIKPLHDGKLAISTYGQGLFIFDKKLNFLYKLNKNNGLKSDRVYTIFEDHQHNLWLPLYYGITQVSLSSPISQLMHKKLEGGLITTLNKFQNTFYIGTTKGLFFSDASLRDLKLVKNTEGENWNVYTYDNQVYLARRDGVFLVQNDIATKLASFRFVHSLTKLKYPDNTFVVGTYDTGIWLLKKIRNHWYKIKIKGFEKETRFIQEDDKGNLWIAHFNEGIYKLTLNAHKDSVLTLHFYDKGLGLPSNKNNRIYRLKNGQIIATTMKGFYRYDSSADKFVAHSTLNKPLNDQFCIYTFSEDSLGNVYFWGGQQFPNREIAGLLTRQPDDSYKMTNQVFNKITVATQGLRVDVDAPIWVDKDQVLIGNESNLKVYNSLQANNINTDYQVIINKVVLKDSVIHRYGNIQKTICIPYELGDIKFSFAAMSYEDIAKNKYSYQLVGYDDEWSKWQSMPTAIFTSLPEGNYIFKVKSINLYKKESEVSTFKFRILPPWYRTWWAYAIYVFLSITIIISIVKANSWRLKQQKKILEIIVQERTEEIRTQNEELQQSQEEILSQRNFIEVQNRNLTEKNNQIQQSIKSALLIQKAILPFDSRIKRFFAEYFIIYKPKDVVSGDFYWIEQINDQTIIVVADCTGHGVPGAFMSLISYNLLDKIIKLQKCVVPSEILEKLHVQVVKLLKQDKFKNNNGLDAAIVVLRKEKEATNITFAGARRPLIYQSAGNPSRVQEIKGTRRSIGGYQNLAIHFQNHQIQLPLQNMIYLGTDGFEDQNDIHRKKFSKKGLIETFNGIVQKPLKPQQRILEERLQKHMQDTEQRDDILCIGIKPQ
ncbi:MAG TPA: hypothetical protein DCS93_11810 [Microscillaceae bacterium]|nr:hypothetical protein [Microscillaceae bacterium]